MTGNLDCKSHHEPEEGYVEKSVGLALGHRHQRLHLNRDSLGNRQIDRFARNWGRRMSSSNDWIFRWFHILAGIMWIGLLYFFNFVNAAAVKEATAAGEAGPISKYVMPRALLYFRWGAVVTWVFGAALLGNFHGPDGSNGFVSAFTLQGVMAP